MKSNNYFLCISTFLIFTAKSVYAVPGISIGSMYDVLTYDEQSMTKRIYNTGDSTAFVRVELYDVHPGSCIKEVESSKNDLSNINIDRNRLIVTPQRLIIPPDSFQSVRILWPGSREKERYCRIRFIPVMPDEVDSFGIDKKSIDEYRKTALNAGINVLTGYGTVLIIQPENPNFETVVVKNPDGSVSLRNSGNAVIYLDNLKHCKSIKSECQTATREFVLPGHTIVVNKKAGFSINFTLIEGRKKRVMIF